MYIPLNALDLLKKIINDTNNLLGNVPRFEVVNYSIHQRKSDTYDANVKFIKMFQEFLAQWFNVLPKNFNYIVELKPPLPRIVHDNKKGIQHRLMIKYWEMNNNSQGSITVQLPLEIWDILLALDLMNQDRGTARESMLPLQVAYFGLTHLRKFCSCYHVGKKKTPESQELNDKDLPSIIVSERHNLIYINGKPYNYPDKILKALHYMLKIHYQNKKYFDRKKLLKYIGDNNTKKPIRALFNYHKPLLEFIIRAKDNSGKYIQNKYVFNVDLNKSRID